MPDERWLYLETAGDRIRERKNLSVGAAAAELQRLCSTGNVRSITMIHGTPYNLQPHEWQLGRLVDLTGGRLGGTHDKAPVHNVLINEPDLEFALGRAAEQGNESSVPGSVLPNQAPPLPAPSTDGKPTIPEATVKAYFQTERDSGRIPAADPSKPMLEQRYPHYKVPRKLVRSAHQQVFPGTPAGKRHSRR